MLEIVKDGRRRIARESVLLFVDFQKAFDKVNRRVLMNILRNRCYCGVDRHCCDLIGLMLNGKKNEYGLHSFELYLGVP